MDGTPSRHTQVQYDGTPESCGPGEFEIETFRMFLDPNNDNGSMHELFDAGFSFVVP